MLCQQSVPLASLYLLSDGQSKGSNANRPTLCRNCGSIVGAGQAQCAVCGASTSQTASTTPTEHLDSETLRYARAILDRPYKFTIIFLVTNIFVFLLMWESSGMSMNVLFHDFPGLVLIGYGAKLNALIQAPASEWWRFVTPMFIHVNLIHLLVNMYSLWIIGPFVEKLYGSAKFVVFWVVTGIAGVVASYLTVRPSLAVNVLARFIFKAQDDPSAGASGALFGLVGVLFVFGIKYRHELPEGFKRAFGTGMLPIILINLFIGFFGPIDNSAHLGGLISGSVLALGIHYRRPGESRKMTTTWRLLQVAALALVVFSFFKTAQRMPLYFAQKPPEVKPQSNNFVAFVSAMNQAQETMANIINDGDISTVDAAVQGLKSVGAPDQKGAELREKLLDIMGRMAAPIANASPTNGPRRGSVPDPKLLGEFAAWRKDYNQWLKVAVQTYSPLPPE